MQVRCKAIAANIAQVNSELGGSDKPLYGGFVPGTDARAVVQVVVSLAPGTTQEGEEYTLPNGQRLKVDRYGCLCDATYAE